MVKRWYCIFLSFCLVSCMSRVEDSYSDTPEGNFQALWEIIDTKYCFLEEKQVDWDGIYRQYHAKVQELAPCDEYGLFDLLASMLDSLRDGHVNLYSPFDVSRNTDWQEGYPANFDAGLLYSEQYLSSDYRMAGGFAYNRIAGGKVGLIRYASFSDGFSSLNMAYILNCFKDCKGLILDLRSNGGGDLEYARKLAAVFFSETRTVGYWQHKTGSGHDDYSPLRPITVDTADISLHWLRPVAVLSNRSAYSATNFFLSAIRCADNARIFGGRSGGGGGMPMSYELPNGWIVRFSSVRMYDAQKQSIENGVLPDEEVILVSDGKDDIIEAATNWILQ